MALTTNRNIAQRAGDLFLDPVAAGAKIYAGALVALNADGYAMPASAVGGLTIRGVAKAMADNSGGGGDGAIAVNVASGVFQFKNSSTDPVDRSDINTTAVIDDDETVARTGGVIAGLILDVDDYGVWVRVGI